MPWHGLEPFLLPGKIGALWITLKSPSTFLHVIHKGKLLSFFWFRFSFGLFAFCHVSSPPFLWFGSQILPFLREYCLEAYYPYDSSSSSEDGSSGYGSSPCSSSYSSSREGSSSSSGVMVSSCCSPIPSSW